MYHDFLKLWTKFCEDIKYNNRFVLDNKFLDELDKVIEYSTSFINAGEKVYRARIYDLSYNEKIIRELKKIKGYTVKEMGKPSRDKCSGGRANPEGISYLYTATNEKTAIGEVRPWLKTEVTVAEFIVKEKLKIVDLTEYKYDIYEISGYFKDILSIEFSKPIQNRNSIDYLPTQYISELIKHKGYFGIMYRSSIGDGSNIVFFNEDKLEIKSIKTFNIRNISYEYESIWS